MLSSHATIIELLLEMIVIADKFSFTVHVNIKTLHGILLLCKGDMYKRYVDILQHLCVITHGRKTYEKRQKDLHHCYYPGPSSYQGMA
jgi:hypothetical protein